MGISKNKKMGKTCLKLNSGVYFIEEMMTITMFWAIKKKET